MVNHGVWLPLAGSLDTCLYFYVNKFIHKISDYQVNIIFAIYNYH